MTGTAVGQHSLREQNLATVVDAVFSQSSPVTRATIAERTGLTKATVSSLVHALLAARIITELPLPALRGVGRPGVPLGPCPRSVVGLGLEVAADYYGGRVIDLTGAVVAERIVATDLRESDPSRALSETGRLARELIESVAQSGMRCTGARLALPGLVRSAAGVLENAPNLGWQSLAPIELLGATPCPVEVWNEAKLAGLAQTTMPTATSASADAALPPTFLYVSGGVGIGSAMILDRTLYEGVHGFAGEIGHVTIHPAGPRCRCGNDGCLEVYAGEEAIAASAGLRSGASSADVAAAVRTGESAALDAVERAGDALGQALADYLNLVDVDTVVLGGSYADLFDVLGPVVSERIGRGVLAARHSPVTVVAAPQRDHAALTGGAWAVLRAVLADPAAWV